MDYKPTIPPRVRDAVYIGGLITAPAVGLIAAIVAIWVPEYSEPVNATAIAVGSFVATIVAGVGTVYRPGAQTDGA